VKYPVSIVLVAAVALIAATPQTAPAPQTSPTPPPPPADMTQPQASVSPAAAPSATVVPPGATTPAPSLDTLLGAPKTAPDSKPHATPSPPPDLRKGLDGVWELQIQRADSSVVYDHFNLKQTGSALVGTYLDNQKNKRYPLAGSVDGDSIRMVVSMPDGSTILLQGRLDGTTDMIGMFTDPKENVPFTAAYRPKEKWVDNLNANPGLPSGGGSTGGIPPK
jgi:hypothetical protein